MSSSSVIYYKMFMKGKWWITYGQGRLVSNIGPGQSSALRHLSIQTLTEIKLYFVYESRDMSDESGPYIILLKLKTILFTWR
jgi:hypothetical protein